MTKHRIFVILEPETISSGEQIHPNAIVMRWDKEPYRSKTNIKMVSPKGIQRV